MNTFQLRPTAKDGQSVQSNRHQQSTLATFALF